MNLTAWRPFFIKNMIAYFKMENGIDSVENKVDIVNIFANIMPAKIKNGFRFNTTSYSSSVDITRAQSINKYSFTDGVKDVPFSVSFWIYHESSGSTMGTVFGKSAVAGSSGATNSEYHFNILPTGILQIEKFSEGLYANGIFIKTSSPLAKNTWLHIVVTDDSLGNTKIYKNAIQQATSTSNKGTGFVKFKNTPSSAVGFGGLPGGQNNSYRFFGFLDEFSVFKNHVLNQKEIDWIYNSGNGRELK